MGPGSVRISPALRDNRETGKVVMPDGNGGKRKTSEKQPPSLAALQFGERLAQHFRNGTCPGDVPAQHSGRWNVKGFAAAVGVHERAVRNWLNGENLPNDL